MADILFDIGLCLQTVEERPKRKTFYNPIVILIIVWIDLAKCFASIMISDDNDFILVCLGDVGRYLGIKFHLNMIFILMCLIAITSQLNYLYGYMRGIEPTFVRVLQSMSYSSVAMSTSGIANMACEVIPHDMGLYRQSDLKQVLQFERVFRFILMVNTFCTSIVAFLFEFVSYIQYNSVITALIFGIPNSWFLALFVHHINNFIILQFAYVFYLCKYLRLRVKNLDTELIEYQE